MPFVSFFILPQSADMLLVLDILWFLPDFDEWSR